MAVPQVSYGMLGPLEAVVEGKPVSLGGRTQRALLGALLLRANETVSADRLVEAVWGAHPPRTAGHAIHVYVSRLRKALGAEAIEHTSSGYVLRVSPDRTDLERFERLVRTARQERAAGDLQRSCELLEEALALWRGPALAGIELEDFARVAIMRLGELRLAAIESSLEARLAFGRHEDAVPELEALVAEYPHDERLCGLLMLALYRSGRQSDALAVYRSARLRLSEGLGIEPSRSLQELERQILAQDVSLELERVASTRSIVVVPGRWEHLPGLVTFVAPLGLSRNPHELIVAWLEEPGPAEAVSRALAEASTVLARLQADLFERGIEARIAAFTAMDRAEETLRLAGRPDVDLLVVGTDVSELGEGRFGSELSQILAAAPCDVALWVRRSGVAFDVLDGPVLVPFGALEHDWAALELAAWLAAATGMPLVLLGAAGDPHGDGRDGSRMLADAGLLIQRATGVTAQPRLVEPGRSGLLEAAAGGGLLVVGLSKRWFSEGLGATRLEVASSAVASVVFVRGGQRPGGISPPEGLTSYRWSVTAAVR